MKLGSQNRATTMANGVLRAVFHLGQAAALTASLLAYGSTFAGTSADALAAEATALPALTLSYYVDYANGNDQNPGTAAKPWASLGQVVKALSASPLQPGQSINLKCGQIWRESLTLQGQQLLGTNTIAGYGPCSPTVKATISGANDYPKGWTLQQGNIWVRAVPTSPPIVRLLVNGTSMRPAQWPNYGGIGKEYAIAASPTSNTSLQVAPSDQPQLLGKTLVNSTIQIRDRAYFIEQAQITGYDSVSGILNFTAPPNYSVSPGNGYVLQGQLWMLDAPGEFFHDVAAGMLYVYPPDTTSQNNMNNVPVEGAVRPTALEIDGVSGMSIKDLALVNATGDALFLNQAPAATVNSIIASGNARSGIRTALGSGPGVTIENSIVANNWQYGIDSTYAVSANILNNTVSDTGTVAYAGNVFPAIDVGDSAVVQGNLVLRSASTGIRYAGSGGANINANDVTSFCVRLSDCGGIYTWNGPKGSQKTSTRSSLDCNRVWGATADLQGTQDGSAYIVAGIYLDDFTMNAYVQNNTVSGVPIGIYVHNGNTDTVQNNRVWLTSVTSLWANMDQTDADYMYGNTFSDNQFIPVISPSGTYPAQPTFTPSDAVWFANLYSGLAGLNPNGNNFHGNQIVQLNGSGSEAAWTQTSTAAQSLTAKGWAALNAGESAALVPATFSLYRATLASELVQNGNFDQGLTTNWGASPSAGGSILAVGSGGLGCSGECVSFTAGSTPTADMLNSAPGIDITTQGALYLLGFNAGYTGTIRVRPWIGDNASGSTGLSLISQAGLTSPATLTGGPNDTYRFEAFLRLIPTSDQMRVNLQLISPSVDVYFDTVSLKTVSGYRLSQPNQWVAAVFANRGSGTSVTCTSLGWPQGCSMMDILGNPLTLPATVPAGSAQVFLRADSPWRN